MSDEVRAWLSAEGFHDLPRSDGRLPTLQELQTVLGAVPSVTAIWSGSVCELASSGGARTCRLVHDLSASQLCEFHFRGGDPSLIERVVISLAAKVGPLVVCAHSGEAVIVAEPQQHEL